jgi:hypothetical protein
VTIRRFVDAGYIGDDHGDNEWAHHETAGHARSYCSRSPDLCRVLLRWDPCAGSPRNGTFCGANLSPLAKPDVLYTCNGQATLAMEACGGGCNAAPLGQADGCAPVEQG